MGDHLGGCVARAGLASCTGEFADAHAVVELGVVALFRDLREVRVKGCSNIGRQAEAVFKAAAQAHALLLTKILHKAFKGAALHTAHPVRAGLLFVGEDTDAGLIGGLNIENRMQLCECAHTVIVAVSADE